jgi:diacylglycerol kinase family enzyme
MLKQGLGERAKVQVELVSDHPGARACAAEFIRSSDAPTVIIAGGGGGTMRAVIEGICGDDASKPLPGKERVCVGALRMGSGNVLAKQFGVPRDPVAGLHGLIENLRARRTLSCCVMRCEVWKSPGHSEVHYAATLAGFGQFGRVPLDLARLHVRLPRLHRNAARLFGIEKLTNLEYALALLLRSFSCVLFTDQAEAVEVHFQNQREQMRLLSGVAMNFPIKALPFKPSVRVEDEAICIYLIPLRGRLSPLLQVFPKRLMIRVRCIRLEKDQRLEIRLTDRDCVNFFLDEDPITTCGRLSFGVAGSIAFVPGSDYQPLAGEGMTA